MFKNKKILKQMEEERKSLEILKNDLLFIKEELEDVTPKIDTSDLYIWEEDGVCSIVKLNIKKLQGVNAYGILKDGFESTLIDIFTGRIIYTKKSTELIKRSEYISHKSSHNEGYYASFIPIYKFDNNILAYPDKKVPLYVLQHIYYRLNNVNTNSHVLKRQK